MTEMSAKTRKTIQTQAENLSKKVEHFTKAEIECLIQHFNSLLADQVSRGKAAHGLDRGRFRGILQNVFGLTNAMMMDGVFRCFDKDGDGTVTVEEWIRGHAVFLRGTLDERMKYCFQVYDLNDDKYISKEEIFHMLKQSFIKQPTEEDPDEGLKEVVEITMKTMDHDHDSLLSFEDFKKSVQAENLLLEAFGTCLPDPMVISQIIKCINLSFLSDVQADNVYF
uniref:Calaxin n=1 Tax=Fundulus heteroclitus TaxID=8078 RepID=A0A3Q2P3B2_FUNHE